MNCKCIYLNVADLPICTNNCFISILFLLGAAKFLLNVGLKIFHYLRQDLNIKTSRINVPQVIKVFSIVYYLLLLVPASPISDLVRTDTETEGLFCWYSDFSNAQYDNAKYDKLTMCACD